MNTAQYGHLYKLLEQYVDELQGFDPTRTDFERVLRHIKAVWDDEKRKEQAEHAHSS